MNVLFDKAMYEKGRSLDTAASSNQVEGDGEKDGEGKAIEKAIKESLAGGKVGSLSVDPNYLEFEPLASKWLDCMTPIILLIALLLVIAPEDRSTTSKILDYLQLSEVRLYIVLALIGALVFVAIVQATCTIMRTRTKSKRHKVSPA